MKHKEENCSITTTSTINNHAQHIAATSMNLVNLHTTTILYPVGKEYVRFQNNDTFEQQYFVIKGMLQSPHLKYYVKTIGIDQPLSNSSLYEYKCLENIKKL